MYLIYVLSLYNEMIKTNFSETYIYIYIYILNKKSEFVNACRHQSKLLLKNLKRNVSMD